MRLLVSVRSAAEVADALAGGADIVDAKEPARGSLGPVGIPELRAISRCLPSSVPFSIALGELESEAALEAAMALLAEVPMRSGHLYIKIGLAAAGEAAGALLGEAVARAARSALRPSVVAVAYADHVTARAPAPRVLARMAAAAGADGVLLDTWGKDGRDLFQHLPAPAVREWVDEAKAAGLLVALAGSLSAAGVRAAAGMAADVVGVRGAACVGGREGVVAETLVASLKASLVASDAGVHA
jgi:uncharacterized protein (UPF0264 family)